MNSSFSIMSLPIPVSQFQSPLQWCMIFHHPKANPSQYLGMQLVGLIFWKPLNRDSHGQIIGNFRSSGFVKSRFTLPTGDMLPPNILWYHHPYNPQTREFQKPIFPRFPYFQPNLWIKLPFIITSLAWWYRKREILDSLRTALSFFDLHSSLLGWAFPPFGANLIYQVTQSRIRFKVDSGTQMNLPLNCCYLRNRAVLIRATFIPWRRR